MYIQYVQIKYSKVNIVQTQFSVKLIVNSCSSLVSSSVSTIGKLLLHDVIQ